MSKLYISIEAHLRKEAEAYCQRATKYLNEGSIDKAIGCLNKALVKTKRADLFKMMPFEEKMIEELAIKIANSILESK